MPRWFRARLRVLALLSSATIAVPLVTPAGAAAAPAGPMTCDLPSADVSQFVSDWAAHLDDTQFMKRFLRGKGDLPFPGATDQQQACATALLVDELTREHPGFGAKRDPDAVRALLASIVFHRGKTDDHQSHGNAPQKDAPTTGLSGALAKLRKAVADSDVPATRAPATSTTRTSLSGAQIQAAGPSAAPADTTALGPVFQALSFLELILAALPLVPQIVGVLGSVLSSVVYKVCAEAPDKARACSLPLPLATPMILDDDGHGGPDVSAALVPLVGPNTSASLQFTVDTLPLATPHASHVFAVFSVLGTGRQFALGFDGRAGRLSKWQQATFTVKSLARALQGDIDTQLKLQFHTPGPNETLTLTVATTASNSQQLSDPITAAVDFAPVPAALTADLRIQNTANPEYTVGVQSTVPTVLTAHATITQTAANSMTAFDARIDKLPTSVNVDVKNTGTQTIADYQGSATIDDLKVAARSIPDLAHPDTYTLAGADVTQIPTQVHLVATKPYDAVLTTNAPIGPTTVALQNFTNGVVDREISAEIAQVPTLVHVHGDVNGAGDDFSAAFTYTASSRVPEIDFRLYDDTDLKAFVDASAQDLPKYVRVSVAKHPHDSAASFDARTDESAAPGSDSVGPITLKYTSTGTQLADADLPSTDHVVMKETEHDLRAALRYTGLSLVSYALHDDQTAADHDTISAELKNSQPRQFTLVGDTPALSADAVVTNLPADMHFDYVKQGTGTDVHYTASDAIDSITAAVTQKDGNHAAVGASIMGVPKDVHLVVDPAAGTADWTADGRVASAGVSGQVDFAGRTWIGGATLTSVAKRWTLHFGPEVYSFQAGTDAAPDTVGSLDANLTNHGSGATELGNHAIANYDAGTGDLDASFRMSDIRSFSYTPNDTGFVATAKAGGGQPFHINANLKLDDGSASASHLDTIAADATINPLPTSMTFTQDGTALDYQSDTSPDITATVAIGRSDAVAAAPTPPLVRGVSVRDGRACDPGCATAYRIRLFLQGAPSGLHGDTKNIDYSFTHYAPPAGDPSFNADVALVSDPDPAKHVIAQVSLKGIDPSGTNMHVGPVTTVDGPVAHSAVTSVHYDGNHSVGPLDATLIKGDKTARVVVSNLPATMDFSATTRPDGIVIDGTLQDPINSIDAFYKPTGAANWALTGSLKQIPRHFEFSQLTIGDQPSSDPCAPPPPKPPVPTVNYSATNGGDDPNTLDITASVDLAQLSSSLSGQVTAGITNLGHETHASWDGTNLTLDSSPRTDAFEVHVPNARVVVDFAFDTSAPDPCNPSTDHSFISITAAGHVHVVIDIGDAGMVLTKVAHLVLQPGFSSGVTGDFETFALSWGLLHASIDAEAHVDLDIDFGGGIEVSPTLASLDLTIGTDVHVDFGIYRQEKNRILHLFPIVPVPCDFEGPIPTGLYFVDVYITPNRIATGHDGFSIDGSPGTTGQWVVTANPFGIIPDVVLDAVTGLFTSPFDKGLDAGFDCD